MSLWTLIVRSLRFHARTHLGTLLGATVGSAVLIGALVVGDSVRGSLRETALRRLAGADLAMDTGDRFFTTALFDHMLALGSNDAVRVRSSPTVPQIAWGLLPGSRPGSALLRLPATATLQDDSARANGVTAYGVGEGFLWNDAVIAEDEAWLNNALAKQLNAKVGDNLVLRVHKPSALSRDAVIVPRDDSSVALRLKVGGIDPPWQGDLSLTPGQTPPLNVFVRIDQLGRATGLADRANVLILGTTFETRLPTPIDQLEHKVRVLFREGFDNMLRGSITSLFHPVAPGTALPKLQGFLDEAWSLADAELSMRPIPPPPEQQVSGALIAPIVELRTPRIFLDPTIEQAALTPAMGSNAPVHTDDTTNGMGVLTYLVNMIRAGDRAAPYSMVAALGPQGVGTNMTDDQILINEWLADDLKVGPGDPVELSYYVLDGGAQLRERTNTFRVSAVIPMRGLYGDPTLMPEFPGLAKAESTHDWDAGFKLVHEIRPKDEEYWKKYRGTPKAFVTLAAGQKMWANRFGNLTSIRWPSRSDDGGSNSLTNLARNLRANLRPEALGFCLESVRERALQSAEQSQDFGGLFLGFSFFLIVAALLLMAMLFQFGVEQRATEVGTLLALGFTAKKVRRMLWLEGCVLASVGGLIGVGGGIWYARALLRGLSTVWRDAVGASALSYHVEPLTLVVGALASVVVAWVTIWLALRKQARQTARELLADGANAEGTDTSPGGRKRRTGPIIGATAGTTALGLIVWSVIHGDTANAESFFSAGALLLVSGLAFSSAYLSRLRTRADRKLSRFTVSGLGVRNCARRRTRSLSTLGLLACGSFLIASIGVFRLDALGGAEKRSSGTGGFALVGASSLPVVQDLNGDKGREFFGLGAAELEGVQVVPLRVRDGDEASCLNLNRAQKPRLLGLNPELLAQRAAFTFAKVTISVTGESPWMSLKPAEADVIPAIGDEASILWAMGKKVGDTVDYVDEHGRLFKVKIVGAVANSILQGNLLIDETEFVRRFPSESGYRMFLIDAPSNTVTNVSATLTRALRNVGLELTPATARLAAFNAVQNTYLGTFQILGGLGLLLGSVGLGVVVLRNVLERRGELALLLAVGFQPRALRWLVVSEHGVLLIAGLALGVLSAAVAVMPALLSPGTNVPYASLSLTLAGVLISGAVWTWLASGIALRGRLMDALRNE